MTSSKPNHLQILSNWALGFPHLNFRKTQIFLTLGKRLCSKIKEGRQRGRNKQREEGSIKIKISFAIRNFPSQFTGQ